MDAGTEPTSTGHGRHPRGHLASDENSHASQGSVGDKAGSAVGDGSADPKRSSAARTTTSMHASTDGTVLSKMTW
jgi:hypothetical protein